MKRTLFLKLNLVIWGIFLGFLMSSSVAYGSSRVFVQNNTSKTLVINTTSTLGKAYWKMKSKVIPPWGRGEIYETNRDEGVKDGTTYVFTSVVTVKGERGTIKQHQQEFALRLKLKGSMVNSHMWQSVRDQVDRQHTWHDDRKKWNANMRIEKRQWNVKYWAFFTGTDDNVEYVFQEEYDRPVGWNKKSGEWFNNHLNILAWNVFMRGFPLAEYQTGRAKMVGPKVPGYDVIAFSEVFDHDGEDNLRKSMKQAGYLHQTKVLGRGRSSGTTWNGGVMIVSRYPIAKTAYVYFGDTCGGEDCNADKGVVYAKINKSNTKGSPNYFHIFATHMNQGGKEWNYQKKQLNIIKGLITKQKIPQDEAIIVLGDLNIKKCDKFVKGPLTIEPAPKGPSHQCAKLNPHYQQMLTILDAQDVAHKGYKYNYDGNVNNFNNWEVDGITRPIHKGTTKNLDHILIVNNGVKPTGASYTETRVLRHYDEWKKLETDLARWDISDHFAVYGNLHFHYDPLADWDPGVQTIQLTRYWHGGNKDVVAVATKEKLNAVKQQGYQRVGDHGLLFRTREAADQWAKNPPAESRKKLVRQASRSKGRKSNLRGSLSRIRSRGISEGSEDARGVLGELVEESEFSKEDSDVVELNENDLDALEETYTEEEENNQDMTLEDDEDTDLAMREEVEGSGEIVERGIKKKSMPRRFILRPTQKGSGKRKGAKKPRIRLTVKPIVPLNLYYSDKYKDYFSTTSLVRGKKAMNGLGKYRNMGRQGYVFSNTMYKRVPNSLRNRMIPMYSWYNSKTRDNLIATGAGDTQHAKKNGYKLVALEGYLIVNKPMPAKGCQANSDCPSSHYCDTKQGVCRPDIR